VFRRGTPCQSSFPSPPPPADPYLFPASLSLSNSRGLLAGFPPTCITAGDAEQTLDAMKTLRDRLTADNSQKGVYCLEYTDANYSFLTLPLSSLNAVRPTATLEDGSPTCSTLFVIKHTFRSFFLFGIRDWRLALGQWEEKKRRTTHRRNTLYTNFVSRPQAHFQGNHLSFMTDSICTERNRKDTEYESTSYTKYTLRCTCTICEYIYGNGRDRQTRLRMEYIRHGPRQ